jgi:hypothetical protein
MLKPKNSQTSECTHIHQTSPPKKFKQMLSANQKADGNCFLGQKTVLMVEFMQQGTTIMSEVYCEAPKVLHRVIQNKRHGMLTPGVVLLHDNACLHTAASHSSTARAFKLGVV